MTDVELKEPLIKNEKIRKAVRAWAEANGKMVFEVQVCYQSYGDGSWSLSDTTHEEDCGLAFMGKIPEGLNLGSRYTIAELCGEEEEWTTGEESKKAMYNLEPTLVNRTAAEQIDDYQMKIYEIVKEVFPDAIGYSAECSEGVGGGNVKSNFRVHRGPIQLGRKDEK